MLIDGLGNATLVNGIVRIETLQRNARGEDVVVGEFAIPVNRIVAVTRGLGNLTNQLAARMKPAAGDEAGQAEEPSEAEEAEA